MDDTPARVPELALISAELAYAVLVIGIIYLSHAARVFDRAVEDDPDSLR